MSDVAFLKEALFEHQFWLQILGDHGRFIRDALSPGEQDKIEKAGYFILIFDDLLEQARKEPAGEQVYALTKQAFDYAEEIRNFKLQLIREHIAGKIKINLPPTFINHMVNEVEECLRILQCLLDKKIASGHPLHYHNLWLPDAAGHAGGIQCGLDDVETDLRDKSQEFEMDFHILHRKAEEFAGYTRTNLTDFPALRRLNSQVDMKIGMFMRFLKDIEELRESNCAVGTLQPLMPDHMYREECYYLLKLSRVSGINSPGCDPAAPRLRD